MWKISARNSLLTGFRPARDDDNVSLQPDQNRYSITQKTLSGVVSLDPGWRAGRTVNCCRKVKTSATTLDGNTNSKRSGPLTISAFGAYMVCLRKDAGSLQSRFNLSATGPETNDLVLQLHKRKICKIILGGMLANMCVESHLRELLEQGFEVAAVGAF
jgi:hypothetical protein